MIKCGVTNFIMVKLSAFSKDIILVFLPMNIGWTTHFQIKRIAAGQRSASLLLIKGSIGRGPYRRQSTWQTATDTDNTWYANLICWPPSTWGSPEAKEPEVMVEAGWLLHFVTGCVNTPKNKIPKKIRRP